MSESFCDGVYVQSSYRLFKMYFAYGIEKIHDSYTHHDMKP